MEFPMTTGTAEHTRRVVEDFKALSPKERIEFLRRAGVKFKLVSKPAKPRPKAKAAPRKRR